MLPRVGIGLIAALGVLAGWYTAGASAHTSAQIAPWGSTSPPATRP